MHLEVRTESIQSRTDLKCISAGTAATEMVRNQRIDVKKPPIISTPKHRKHGRPGMEPARSSGGGMGKTICKF